MQSRVAPDLGRIIRGDCLSILSEMPDSWVDLVFADPPFNIGYDYDEYHDRQDEGEYLAWCAKWMQSLHRLLKPNGTFWLAIGDEYAAELKLTAQKAGFSCRSWVVWYYTFGVNCVRGFSRSHTHLFHFVKDPKSFTFNAENPSVRVLSARQLVYADGRANPTGRLPDNTWFYRPQDIPSGFLPRHDTWYFARVAGTFREREGFHGCQMPEGVLGRIIHVSSKPGDVVLDPFTGSGTTLAVAKKLGRQWLGIELSADYARKAEQRLKNTKVGDSLDGPRDPLSSAPKTKDGRKRGRRLNGNAVLPSDEDTIKGVISAYEKVNHGQSTDVILCDPALNSSFVEACRKSEIAGNAFTWNRLLLRIRKSGRLPRTSQQGRKRITFRQMDSYSFASEIAMRFMELDYGLTLDDVLCRPEVAQVFDEYARRFSPGHSSFEYRWAALSIRKRSSHSRALARQEFHSWRKKALPRPKPIEDVRSSAKYERPGVYIVQNERQPLYVGETINVKERIDQVVDGEGWSALQPTCVRLLESDEHLHGLQSVLVGRENPLLNTQLLSPETAAIRST